MCNYILEPVTLHTGYIVMEPCFKTPSLLFFFFSRLLNSNGTETYCQSLYRMPKFIPTITFWLNMPLCPILVLCAITYVLFLYCVPLPLHMSRFCIMCHYVCAILVLCAITYMPFLYYEPLHMCYFISIWSKKEHKDVINPNSFIFIAENIKKTSR